MPRPLRRQGILDPLQLVCSAGVLGLRVVVEVEHAVLVDGDVLEDRPVRVRRREDLGLRRRRQADHLRVAAAFDVEDTGVAPAVLVVADQRALRIGGQCRLAGAREAEEDRDAPVVGDVRRAVHREHAFERQPIVHDGEDRLLDLARVERAADEQLGAPRMEHDERPGAGAVLGRVGLEVGRVQHERRRRNVVGSPAARSMNIVLAKSAWYGCAVITRTPIRCAASAPAQASTT